MNITRISAIVLRQYYLLRGSPTRLLPMLVWVTIDMVHAERAIAISRFAESNARGARPTP